MAKYALVIGISYEEPDVIYRLGSSVSNAANISNFFIKVGFEGPHLLLGSSADFYSIYEALKSIRKKLQTGDTFCLYFSGYGAEFSDLQYILAYDPKGPSGGDKQYTNALSLEFIEEMCRVPGVERIFIMDLANITSINEGPNAETITHSIQHAPENSPIGVLCCKYNELYSHVFIGINSSAFTYALLIIFEDRFEAGLEISFPSVRKPVITRIAEWADFISKELPTCFCSNLSGNGVVIHPGERAIADLPDEKRIKAEADAVLEKLLEEHTLWQKKHPTANNDYRLTFQKLKPVIDIYQSEDFGSINLARRNLKDADFSDSSFPEGTVFSFSDLSRANFSKSILSGINFSNCWFKSTFFELTDISCCNFTHSYWIESELPEAKIKHCIFDQSLVELMTFPDSKFTDSSFRGVLFSQADLSDWSAINCDLTDVNLYSTILVRANLSGSTLTGARLYGTARTDWCIEGVKCKYVYWDHEGKERFPPEADFEEGEFSTQYRPYTTFSYTFTEGITPSDLALATYIVERINTADTGFKIKIDNASLRGLNPSLNFIMESGDEKRDDARKLFKAMYKHVNPKLEEQCRRLKTLQEKQDKHADQAEIQSSKMMALAEHSSSKMDKLFEGDIWISQYLENKSKRVSDFVPEDFKGYSYIALYGFGRYVSDIPQHEMDLMCSRLSCFMEDKCLMVSETELDNVSDDAPIRSFYRSFNERPAIEAFVAVATVHSGINDNILNRPVYHELKLEQYGYWEMALAQALERLRVSMFAKSLKDISLPDLPSAKKTLVCLNWPLVQQLRNERVGSQERLCELEIKTSSHPEKHKISKTTLIKVEAGNPVRPSTLENIAKVLKVAPERLVFERVVPNTERLRKLREAVLCTEEELLEQFGIVSPVFFDLLEEAKVVPVDTMRYIHHHYGKLLGSAVGPFSELVDLSSTTALIEPL